MKLRRLANIATALAVLAILAGPAWSARVVEVRVGNHPKFTRVVFELDAPAGYRIERHAVDGGHEVVVKLSAASAPRQLKSSGPVVAGVDLEQSGTDSVARVRTRGGSPRVKEMILGGPPRIVLDFMLPDAVVSKASTPPVAPEPEAAPSVETPPVVAKKDAAEPAAAGAKAAKTKTDSKAKAEPVREAREPATLETGDAAVAPKLPEEAQPPKVAKREQPPVVAPQPVVAPKPVAAPQPVAATKPLVAPKPVVPPTPTAETPIAKVESALEGERIVETKVAQPDPPKQAELESPAPAATASAPAGEPPAPVAKAPSETPPKPVAKAPTSPAPMRSAKQKGPFGLSLNASNPWLTLGLVGGGLLIFLIVVVSLLRRHSKPTSLDALELAREAGEEPMESEDVFTTITGAETKATRTSEATVPVAGPGLFDDEREKGENEMDVAMDLPSERGARAQSMASDSDFAPMVQELERRMAQLESRLDEANEARERLERQVTAQSEELRVQRAAIARTQRALRGMTRIGEDQATEPALRDPSKPTAGRG